MNHTEAAQYIKATLTAFGPCEAISMTKETWAKIHEAMQVLAQPEQEPVAWWRLAENDGHQKYPVVSVEKPHQQWTTTRPLVFGDTPPPQRTWVGLTDEEMDTEADKKEQGYGFIQGALWAEDKLKEKNT